MFDPEKYLAGGKAITPDEMQKHYSRYYKDELYREGYVFGTRDVAESRIRHLVPRIARDVMALPVNRRLSQKAARRHPLGALNVEAIHSQSAKKGTIAVTSTINANFIQTGDPETDEGEGTPGLAIFELTMKWWPKNRPFITGIYSWDPTDPTRSRPLLKMYEMRVRAGQLEDQGTRTAIERFMRDNGAPHWFHNDTRQGQRLLIPISSYYTWEYGRPVYDYKTPLTKKEVKAHVDLHVKHKFRIRFYRDVSLLTTEVDVDSVHYRVGSMIHHPDLGWVKG